MKSGSEFVFHRAPRVLLIDDDPLFGGIVLRLAQAGNIILKHAKSLKALHGLDIKNSFDLIITDFELENVTGIQLIKILESRNQALPTILISSYSRILSRHLPLSIVYTLHKCEGPQRILYAALCLFNKIAKE